MNIFVLKIFNYQSYQYTVRSFCLVADGIWRIETYEYDTKRHMTITKVKVYDYNPDIIKVQWTLHYSTRGIGTCAFSFISFGEMQLIC